jgi:hypothetical protein
LKINHLILKIYTHEKDNSTQISADNRIYSLPCLGFHAYDILQHQRQSNPPPPATLKKQAHRSAPVTER